MKLKFEPNKISFDEAGFRNELMGYIRNGMDSFEKRYLEIMSDKIMKFDHTPEYFKEVVSSELKHIEEILTDGVLTYVAGFDQASSNPFDLMKAYVVAFGMGSEGRPGGQDRAIYAGPHGRMVYDNTLDGQHPSNIPGEGWPMPKTWNHPGIDFVVETNNDPLVQTEFVKTFEMVCRNLPVNIVSKHIKVG